ncbi:MAG: Flp pilus assembly complex ATPase component TadA [Candidatus Omnitrophica bacterium]|nr:Flp pilus assembly complex ATPase component TadA [Candidatus Omnitrophota bacterium]
MKQRIGQALIQQGLITAEQLNMALTEQAQTKEALGGIVVKLGFLSPKQLSPFLADYFELPFVNLNDIYKEIPPEVIRVIPEDIARRFEVLPIKLDDNLLTLAMVNPLDVVAEDTIKIRTGLKVRPAVCSEEDINTAIDYCYRQLPRMQEHINNFIELESGLRLDDDIEKLRIEASETPVVQYVDSLIIQAINSNASDIHIQPKEKSAELRFRIDGVLYDIDPPPKSMLPAITTRIKILSSLDITERRLPQDGRFRIKIGPSEIDIRTSCFPIIYGESIVMRLLNTSRPFLGLEHLGFMPEDLKKFRRLIHRPYGLILVTGPTGSGKTTTLYTALSEMKSREKNIITLENPVEYRLPFIQQSQINYAIGFNFAKGLRAILRQDPDIIMVGEIRDRETAEIAIHAALTGHLVLSTLHTNDSSGATTRLINMGIEPFLITSSLLGVLAQRLVRCICENCRTEYKVDAEILNKLLLKQRIPAFYKGTGCSKCLNSGYQGRTAIFELLTPSDKITNLVLSRASSDEIKRQAQENGMKTLRENGLEKLKQEITTPDEVIRVTQEEEF